MVEQSIELFFSYAHEDESFKDELLKHLRILRRQGIISAWHDRLILPGSEWDQEIQHYLSTADIILLLVSPDFLDSDYSWGVEVKKAMQRHEAAEACVVPVILRVCNWKKAPFAKLQALPKNAEPITKWADRDEAFDNVAQGIELAVEQLLEKRKESTYPSAQELQASLENSFSELPSPKMSAEDFFDRAHERQNNGDNRGAIEDYDQAIQLKSDYADAYYNRGNSYQSLGNKQSAIADFQKAANLYQQQEKTEDYQDALNRVKKLQ
jgi:hypothetical protein